MFIFEILIDFVLNFFGETVFDYMDNPIKDSRVKKIGSVYISQSNDTKKVLVSKPFSYLTYGILCVITGIIIFYFVGNLLNYEGIITTILILIFPLSFLILGLRCLSIYYLRNRFFFRNSHRTLRINSFQKIDYNNILKFQVEKMDNSNFGESKSHYELLLKLDSGKTITVFKSDNALQCNNLKDQILKKIQL